MIRVYVRCDYDAPRAKLIERLTNAGFCCIEEWTGEQAPAAALSAPEENFAERAEEGAVLLCVPRHEHSGWADEAIQTSLARRAGLVVVTRKENLCAAEKELRGSGASVLAADVHPAMLIGALTAAAKAGERLAAARQESDLLREKLECERIVGRAKVALVERNGMTESEAHRYIEKASMDGRVSRKKIAQQIVDAYRGSPR